MENKRLEMVLGMLKQNPDDSFLNYAAALELKKNGELEKATSILQNLMTQDPNYLATYYQLGKLLENEGKQDEAIQVYLKGKIVAEEKKDQKTIGEISEALMLLDWDEY